jgi:hypothetical protein
VAGCSWVQSEQVSVCIGAMIKMPRLRMHDQDARCCVDARHSCLPESCHAMRRVEGNVKRCSIRQILPMHPTPFAGFASTTFGGCVHLRVLLEHLCYQAGQLELEGTVQGPFAGALACMVAFA